MEIDGSVPDVFRAMPLRHQTPFLDRPIPDSPAAPAARRAPVVDRIPATRYYGRWQRGSKKADADVKTQTRGVRGLHTSRFALINELMFSGIYTFALLIWTRGCFGFMSINTFTALLIGFVFQIVA